MRSIQSFEEICKSHKNRQHNDQKKNDNNKNNGQQNTAQNKNGNEIMLYCTLHCKNILWIPKRYSEAISLRRAFYTIIRRKGQQQSKKRTSKRYTEN
jgi:hypothetical protein